MSKGVSQVGLGSSPDVSEVEILAAPERVLFDTVSGTRCELRSPDVLEWAIKALPMARRYIAEHILRGANVGFEVLPMPDGTLPLTMIAHDEHKAVLPREHVIAVAGGECRLRIAHCPDSSLYFVGQ